MLTNQEDNTIIADLTIGNPAKTLIVFAGPLFLSNLLQTVYSLTDTIIVGHYVGTAGLSAVSIGSDVLSFLTFVAMGLSNAGQVLISQSVGAKNKERAGDMVAALFILLFFGAIGISLVSFLLRYQIIAWLHTPDEAADQAMDYLLTCIVGLFFVYGYNVTSAILRGMGDSRRPFLFISIAAVVNVLLDLLFIIVFHLGVLGAALATVIGQGLSFLLAFFFLWQHRTEFCFPLSVRDLRIKKDVCYDLLRLGTPMVIQLAAIQFSILLVNSWINVSGVVVSAVNGISSKLNKVVNLLSNSFATAGGAMIGQSIGAGKYRRVSQVMAVSVTISLAIAAIASCVVILFPNAIFGLFSQEAETLAMARTYIPVAVTLFFGGCLRGPMNAFINGMGNYKLNLCVAIFDSLIGRIGIAAMLGFGFQMGIFGFWYGHALAGYMPFLVGTIYFFSGAWKRTRPPEE